MLSYMADIYDTRDRRIHIINPVYTKNHIEAEYQPTPAYTIEYHIFSSFGGRILVSPVKFVMDIFFFLILCF